jgi:hypothetical protein
MAFMDTGDLTIPDQVLTPWLGKIQYGSVVATLSDQTPMRFGQGSTMTFDIGEAEYVAEGANKGASTVTPTTKTVKPFKFHKTLRWTEEVMWADEDAQLGVVSQILDLIQPALSRALDYGVLHGINPTGGAEVAAMTDTLDDTANSVEIAAAAPYTYLDSAATLILADGFVPRDIALDPSWASAFSTRRGTNTEMKLYPNFQLRTSPVSELDGFRASVSNTVGAVGVAAVATTVKAFMGDFSAIRWGVQRQIGLEVIRYGDPDGQGDLKRNNQIAFRAEVVYGWGIADTNAFAKILDAA